MIGAAGAVSKQGYLRTWTQTTDGNGPTGSLEAYCYQARPTQVGKTGVRGFGGDASGSLVQDNGGSACCTAAGVLSPACAPLR